MKKKVVILANGAFPRKGGAARAALEKADVVVACDGAADVLYRMMKRRADYIVGDLDSLSPQNLKGLSPLSKGLSPQKLRGLSPVLGGLSPQKLRGLSPEKCKKENIIYIFDQNTNDLTKAIEFCRGKGWREPIIVGATGKREDHSLGNIFRAMEAGVDILTDTGVFRPIPECNRRAPFVLKVKKGTPISIFATDPETRMTSAGLEWPLDGVRFANLYCATLNHANCTEVTLTTSHPAFLFYPFC